MKDGSGSGFRAEEREREPDLSVMPVDSIFRLLAERPWMVAAELRKLRKEDGENG